MAIEVRPFHPDDAPQLADIVQRCLREVNSRDYPADIIDKMCAHFTAERFIELSAFRLIYVAEDDKVVGTVSRDGNKVHTMFVDPDLAGRGIGQQLMRHIETLAARDGWPVLSLCQIAAVRAKTRVMMRTVTPAGVPSAVSFQIELEQHGRDLAQLPDRPTRQPVPDRR